MAWTLIGENIRPDNVWKMTAELPVSANIIKIAQTESPWVGQVQIALSDGQTSLPLGDLKADYESQLIMLPVAPILTMRRIGVRLVNRNLFPAWRLNIYSEEISMPIYNPTTVTVTPATASTVAASTVAASITSTTIVAANSSRKGATIWNASTATLYLDLDSSASTSDYASKLDPGGYFELPYGYTGVISGIWSAVNGSALVREFV